jgi:peroxiredoxin
MMLYSSGSARKLTSIGGVLPGFELPDQNKVVRSLKDFSGKRTVIAFFPGAFTSVCTKEMCAFRDSIRPYLDLGAQVVGISVNDPFTNKAFAEQNALPFLILSDYTRETIRRYNLFHEDFAGLKGYTAAKRAVIILDEGGSVRYKWISDDPNREPDYEEIVRQLSQLVIK